MKKLIFSIISLIMMSTTMFAAAPRISHEHPDFEKIKKESTDENSKYFYNKLLEKFMRNDTTMTADEYHYFYYGTMFQEDYNPYRENPYANEVKQLSPLYYKTEHLNRSELEQIENLSRKVLQNNPLDLTQLKNFVYIYEKKNKLNLAKIWKTKLDNILLTIATSGTGADPEHAFVIVYPSHEFEYFNISGLSVEGTQFQEPYYEKVTVRASKKAVKEGETVKTADYFFDLHHLLEQYYLKHPDELK